MLEKGLKKEVRTVILGIVLYREVAHENHGI